MIQYEAVIAIVHLQQRRAREFLVDSKFDELPLCETQMTVGIGDADDALVAEQAAPPSPKREVALGNAVLSSRTAILSE